MSRIVISAAAVLSVVILAACGSGTSNKVLNTGGDNLQPFLVEKPLAPGERAVSAAPGDDSEDYVFSWDLIAGQNQLAGTVDVALGSEELCVTYNLNAGFEISEAQLYIGLTKPDPKGNPGQFPYKETFDPAVNTWTVCVDLDDLGDIDECCETVYIASHATSNSQTIWGGNWNDGDPEYEFTWSKKWGGYFSIQLLPNPTLPGTSVQYQGGHYGAFSYWGINFVDASFPAGTFTVSPAGDLWVGWCVDKYHSMYANSNYTVTLLSSYDSNLPAFAANANWDKINYMITQRNAPTGAPWTGVNWSDNANKDAFQEALWYYSDGLNTSNALALQFIADTEAEGDNFVAHCGDFYAVILYPGNSNGFFNPRAQMNIVEVECNN